MPKEQWLYFVAHKTDDWLLSVVVCLLVVAMPGRLCSDWFNNIASTVESAWGSTFVLLANSSTMIPRRTNTTVMNVASAELEARITSSTVRNVVVATPM
ncbi:hypothetical protein QN277_022990 [Acacia crassicarpa]|uniref:Uncharacterized protein n=1 Tax=Acacia crassicarpa TaxID=499986 RepID=A0AAE1JKC9_9FABA|nr:hypothetical protein QN277_022990 [Acacia crassicarpa]